MKSLLLAFIFSISFSAVAQATPERDASIKSLFGETKKLSKGALDLNVYQTITGRVIVLQNGVIVKPPADTLLTVAFRNAKAQSLANLDFYIGNRYGSNYWELNNKFNATPEEQAAQAFNLNHANLVTHPEALPFALSMAKHQLLELFYMQKSPTSNLTKSYNQRGVADDAHELKYYRLYADFVARHIQYENEYLLLLDFQKRSNLLPGKKTISLSDIRALVADVSMKFDTYLPPAQAAEFRALRNSIHNGMNKSVLAKLTQFQSTYSALLLPEDNLSYENLKNLISAYYAIDKETMSVLASKVKVEIPELNSILNSLSPAGNSLNSLLKLSQLAVLAKDKFYVTHNIDLTHLIIRIQDFMDAELGNRIFSEANDLLVKTEILSNISLATGYMAKPRHAEIIELLKSNPQLAVKTLSQTLSEGVLAYENAYQPALADWKLVSTSVASFVDEGIRSSSLIALDATLTQLKIFFPQSNGNVSKDFSIENNGVGYGYLKFIPRAETDRLVTTLTYQMIPVFESLPLDLGVVAGVITEEPQTPLSHVNIKSKNRGTPNVFVKGASQDSRIKDLLAKNALVRFELKDGVMNLREVSLVEAQAYWDAQMNNKPAIQLRADLNEKRVRPSDQLGFQDVISVGAKAANYCEATHFLSEAFRPAFAVPFFYYREFINTNRFDAQQTLSEYITTLVQNPKMKTDRQFLVDSLSALQKRMQADDMIVNPELAVQIKSLSDQMYPGQRMRLRSSTNSEDMPQFTGAGLYDSDAYDPNKPKKTIQKALKLVWSSVWNLRAFDERELFKINHLDVSMAVLVSPAYPDEVANGVGVSRNIIDPKEGPGVYLNIQKGSEAVTNPNPAITPDQILVLLKKDAKTKTKYTLQYLKYSSLTLTEPVLPYEEVEKIVDYLLELHKHFSAIYHPKNDNPSFALDVEFKVDTQEGSRKVHYKQARPFVGL